MSISNNSRGIAGKCNVGYSVLDIDYRDRLTKLNHLRNSSLIPLPLQKPPWNAW